MRSHSRTHPLLPSLATLVMFMVIAGSTAFGEISKADRQFFESKIRPVLADNCYRCHSVQEKVYKGGLILDTKQGLLRGGDKGPAIVPGKPNESLLLKAVKHDGRLKMPKQAPKLSATEIANLNRWIAMGAPDPRAADSHMVVQAEIDYNKGRKFWSFQPISNTAKTELPSVKNTDWPRAPLDHFVLAGLENEGLTPVRDADHPALLRRVSFDLIGLPPTPNQQRAFAADIAERGFDAAFADTVDDLLDSSHFGERWGRHWLDVARYAESSGMERNYTFSQAWRYRDYVIDAFNRDLPYDRFVQEQIAGDLLPHKTNEEKSRLLVATGFLAMGPKSLNERDKKLFKADIVDEQIDVSTRAVLGLTVSCARCHDHKFDPISQEDYYAIAGFFQSCDTLYGTSGGGGNRQPSTLMAIGDADAAKAKALEEHTQKIAKMEGDKRRMTIQVNQAKQEAKVTKGAERSKVVKKLQTSTKSLRTITSELSKLKKSKPKVTEQCMGVRDMKTAADTKLALRGDVHRTAQTVPRGFLKVMLPLEEKTDAQNTPAFGKEASGRLELAQWLTTIDNPLTARVMVNRIWHHLFGQGIVRTVDNFGESGERPSDPALLDHLARRFIEHEWSVKDMLREIVLSRSYQLSSDHDEDAYEIDPDNRLVWQQSHRRLDAEAIRDAMMLVSGVLDVSPREKSPIAELGEVNIGRSAPVLNKIKSPSNHRSVYLPIVRNLVPQSLQVFDFAEPSMLVGRRNVTTVPSQALYLLNSKRVEQLAEKMAERLSQETGVSAADDEKLERLFAWTLCREPDDREREQIRAFIATCQQNDVPAWPAVCQSIFASAEFRYLD